jgi:hypothetical protein
MTKEEKRHESEKTVDVFIVRYRQNLQRLQDRLLAWESFSASVFGPTMENPICLCMTLSSAIDRIAKLEDELAALKSKHTTAVVALRRANEVIIDVRNNWHPVQAESRKSLEVSVAYDHGKITEIVEALK